MITGLKVTLRFRAIRWHNRKKTCVHEMCDKSRGRIEDFHVHLPSRKVFSIDYDSVFPSLMLESYQLHKYVARKELAAVFSSTALPAAISVQSTSYLSLR